MAVFVENDSWIIIGIQTQRQRDIHAKNFTYPKSWVCKVFWHEQDSNEVESNIFILKFKLK